MRWDAVGRLRRKGLGVWCEWVDRCGMGPDAGTDDGWQLRPPHLPFAESEVWIRSNGI
jgi:hypothetical protein